MISGYLFYIIKNEVGKIISSVIKFDVKFKLNPIMGI